jgi:hypothetical protein
MKSKTIASFTVESNYGYHEMIGAREYRDTPVRVSIPLAAGVCAPDAALELCDEKGRNVPCQANPFIRWPDGSVRVWELWFPSSFKRGESRRFELRRARNRGPSPQFPLADSPEPSAFRIALQPVNGAMLRSRVEFKPDGRARGFIEEEHAFDLSRANGTVRFKGAIIRRSFSWHPGVEIEIRLTNYGAADIANVRKVRLEFDLPIGQPNRYCIRQSCFMLGRPRLVERKNPFIVRADDHGIHVTDPAQLGENEKDYPQYERGAYLGMVNNWVGASDGKSGWVLALQEAAERAPKSWRIEGRRVVVDLHPDTSDALAWRQGMTLFQRLYVARLPGRATAADFENEAQAWLRKPIVTVPADVYRAAGWRIPFPYNPKRFPKTEFQFRDNFNFNWATGTFHWGDCIIKWGDKAHGIQPSGRNLEYDFVAASAKEYARTGRTAIWKLCRPAAEHMMYTDFIDFSTDEWKNGGIAAHGPGHTWGSCYPSHMWGEGLTLYYQLTGDRHALYVVKRIGDFFLKYIRERFVVVQGTPREMGWLLVALEAIYDLTREPRYLEGIKRVVDFNLGLGPRGFFPLDATFAMGVSIIGLNRSRLHYRDADTRKFILGLLDHLLENRRDEIGLFEYWRDSEQGIIPYIQTHLPEGLNIGYRLSGNEKYLRAAWRLYQIFLGGGPMTVQNRNSATECGFAAGHHISWMGCLQSFAEKGWLDRLQYPEPGKGH